MMTFTKLNWILAVSLILSLVACENNDGAKEKTISLGADLAGSAYYNSNTNSARVFGETIGSNTDALEALRKPLNLKLLSKNPNFEIGKLYATRSNNTSTALYWILSVKNTSNFSYCFVKLSNIIFSDKQGNTLASNSLAYINGGSDDQNYTETCIQAGEIAYVANIETDIYDDINTVTIGEISANDGQSVSSKLAISSYEIPTDNTQSITINSTNTGTKDVTASSSISTYILLDADGEPLHWSYINSVTRTTPLKSVTLAPNKSISTNSYMFYNGAAAGIRVITNIDASPVVSTATNTLGKADADQQISDFDSTEQYDHYLSHLINARIDIENNRR